MTESTDSGEEEGEDKEKERSRAREIVTRAAALFTRSVGSVWDSATTAATDAAKVVTSSVSSAWDRLTTAVTWRRVRITLGVLLAIATPTIAVYMVYDLTESVLDTAVYTLTFLFTASIIPIMINLLGAATPGGASLGKGHFIIGNIAARYPYLVQKAGEYRLCIGREDAYYLDGEWHKIDDGERNRTILGWREVGFIWHKLPKDVDNERADTGIADGGDAVIQRGGQKAVARPSMDSLACPSCESTVGTDTKFCPNCGNPIEMDTRITRPDGWLISVHRLYGKGLEMIGNINLLETAEEQAKRDEVSAGIVDEWSRVLAVIVMFPLSFIGGYIVFFLT